MPLLAEKRAEVLAALEDIVSSAPETVAECTYFQWTYGEPEAAPVCVVGHLIKRLEPETFQRMVDIDSDESGPSVSSIVVEALRKEGVPLSFDRDRDLIFALGVLQGEQDNGKTWAEAYAEFKKTLEKMDGVSNVGS